MKITEEKLPVETSGNLAHKRFSIATTRKSFKILSDTLYSQKIAAVIRELSTNAADAHVVEGKKDVPFEIHLPNVFEPWFSVKDQGSGLSEEEIYSLYTTYFASDKTETNDLTGCLGLGSKSPFAYSASFCVSSTYKGIKTDYTCYVDADGIPVVTKMQSGQDEGSGLEVKIPVQDKDFDEFHEKAAEILTYFSPRPVVKGKANFEFDNLDYEYSCPEYSIFKTYHDSHVIMGNVAYLISHQLSNHSAFDNLEKNILKAGVDLYVPIGSVEPTPNRESLSFEEKTINTIKERLLFLQKDVIKRVTESLKGATTLWEARKLLYIASHKVYHSIINKTGVELTWNGQKLGTSFCLRTVCEQEKIDIPLVESISWDCDKFKKIKIDYIYPDGNPIFICDLNKGNYVKIKEYLSKHNFKKGYLIHEFPELYRILKEEGIGGVKKASILPNPPKITYDKVSYSKFYKFKPYYGSKSASYWDKADVDVKKGGIYVVISHFNFRFNDDSYMCPSFLTSYIKDLNLFTPNLVVYGVRAANVASIEKKLNWTRLFDYTRRIYNKHIDEYRDKIEALQQANNYSHLIYYKTALKKDFDSDTLFGKFANLVKNINIYKTDEKVSAFLRIQNMLGEKPSQTENILDKINKRYPLLQYLSSYHSGEDNISRYMEEYIKLVDK